MKTYFLSIWPTDGCNLYGKCEYCFYEESALWDVSKAKMMSTDVADAIIERINSGAVEGLSFFGAEPTLNMPIIKRILAGSQLPSIMREKTKRRSWYNITTNGTLLSEDTLDFLSRYKVHMNLSLDGTKETQDYWRGNSYDAIIKNLPNILKYPSVNILKTLANPENVYEDVKHIKGLGFKGVFMNLLDPYSHHTYEEYDVEEFKRQYRRVITELDGPDFRVGDYHRWKTLINPKKKKKLGCGFSNRGLCVDWEGNLWPCHQGPSLPKDFIIGNIWDGLDENRDREVRNVPNAPSCTRCVYKLTKCYVSMYNQHGRFGVDAPEWYRRFAIAKIEIIEELEKFSPSIKACTVKPTKLLLATLISKDKTYLLNPFMQGLMNLNIDVPTDYLMVIDEDSARLKHLLKLSLEGRCPWLPNLNDKFDSVRILKMPIKFKERYMFRIARGRNMVLGIARNPQYFGMMFIDADIIPDVDAIPKMLGIKAEIVGALVKCRRDHKEGWYNNYISQGDGTFKREQEFKRNSILDVDATGCDCVLVRRKAYMTQRYQYKPEIPEAEDMGFCIAAKKKGFSIKIHTGVSTRHIGINDVKLREVKSE